MLKSAKIFLLVTAMSVAFLVPTVFAQEDSNTNSENNTTSTEVSPTPTISTPNRAKEKEGFKLRMTKVKEKNQEIRDNMKERASASAEKRQERLNEARLKICEARQKNITNRIKFMQQRAVNIHKAHERAYNLTNKFYTEKLVPNGYSLSNYADLIAEIEANRANVVTLLESTKTTGGEFDCSSDDPKGQADAFREDMKALIDANQAYKISIKNFIQAVRDLAETARLEKISGTPTPVVTEGAL